MHGSVKAFPYCWGSGLDELREQNISTFCGRFGVTVIEVDSGKLFLFQHAQARRE